MVQASSGPTGLGYCCILILTKRMTPITMITAPMMITMISQAGNPPGSSGATEVVGASVGVTSDVIAVGVGGASDGGGVGSIVAVGTGVGTATGVAVGLGKTTATVGAGVGANVGATVGSGVGFIVGAGVGIAAGVAERNSQMLLASDVSTFVTTVVPALPRLATHGSGDAWPEAPRQSTAATPSLSTMMSLAAAWVQTRKSSSNGSSTDARGAVILKTDPAALNPWSRGVACSGAMVISTTPALGVFTLAWAGTVSLGAGLLTVAPAATVPAGRAAIPPPPPPPPPRERLRGGVLGARVGGVVGVATAGALTVKLEAPPTVYVLPCASVSSPEKE